MSLNYKLDKIKGYKEICWIPNTQGEGVLMNPITHNLIFSTISVGMGVITDENFEEFYFRLNICERLYDTPKDQRLSMQDVLDHVGLSTNVSFETRPKWIKRHMDYEWRETLYAAKIVKADSN